MSRRTGSGLRHLFPPRRRPSDLRPDSAGLDEIASEYSTEELQEFLEADHLPEEADPDFREALRQRLWELLETERARRSTDVGD